MTKEVQDTLKMIKNLRPGIKFKYIQVPYNDGVVPNPDVWEIKHNKIYTVANVEEIGEDFVCIQIKETGECIYLGRGFIHQMKQALNKPGDREK